MIALLMHHDRLFRPEVWRALAGSYDVPALYLSGEPYPGFIHAEGHELPGQLVACVTPCPGATPLEEFEHPADATYAFGTDDATKGWTDSLCSVEYVTIPTPGGTQLFSYVAAGIVLWDRTVKNGCN